MRWLRSLAVLAATAALASGCGPSEASNADASCVPTDRYFVQLRARQTAAARAIHDADAGLAALRHAAGERYAKLKTIETAAEEYRTAHATALATTEQGHADDIAAARFLRLRAASRRAGRAAQ